MYRAFDLSVMRKEANQLLNNPELRLISMNVSCSAETGYTVASMRFAPCEKQERRFIRKLERFVMFDGGNQYLDERLSDKNVRLIKQYIFPTNEGTIIVLDYHTRKERLGHNGTIQPPTIH